MKKKVYAYLHTHWDREWYRDKEDFNLRLLEVFDIVLDELSQNRAPFFYFDGQVVALCDYLKYRANKKPLIKKLIKENKLAIGPFFVSADSFLISYPFMLKNLDFGLKISKEFKQKDYIGYMCDIFGVSNSIFCALKEKNIDKSLIWRGVNPKEINNCCDFIKNNINTTWLVQGYFNDHLNSDNIEQIAKNLKIHLDKINKYSQNNLLMPIGADHLGILKDANNKIKKINSYLDDYEIMLTSPFEYFKNTKFKNKTKCQEFLDNSNTYILQGTYSARIDEKIRNNYVQNKISKVIEPLNYYLKLNYQQNIDFASITLIKNHAHDGICGCSIDEVHKAINSRLDKCENIIRSIENNIIKDFKNKNNIKGKSSDKIGVFNLTNEDIKIVQITTPYKIKNSQILSKKKAFPNDILYDCYKIPITQDITTIYTQLVEISDINEFGFSISKIKKPSKKTILKDNSIENDYIKFEIKNSKCFIINKKTKEKISFKLYNSIDEGDSYNSAPKDTQELKLIKFKKQKDGKIQSSLRLFYKDMTLDVILDNHSKFIEFNSIINNKQKNHKIQASFVLNKNIETTTAQDAFGIIKRNHDYNYDIKKFMPAKKPHELKTNTYPMQSFTCAYNNSILTKGLNEYEIYKNELKICLLRSFSTISNPNNKTRYIPAGPNLETHSSQLLGKTTQNFAFLFGDYKDCFKNLDIFYKNYLALDGEFNDKKINFKFDKIPQNCHFYCINQKKEIFFKYD